MIVSGNKKRRKQKIKLTKQTRKRDAALASSLAVTGGAEHVEMVEYFGECVEMEWCGGNAHQWCDMSMVKDGVGITEGLVEK